MFFGYVFECCVDWLIVCGELWLVYVVSLSICKEVGGDMFVFKLCVVVSKWFMLVELLCLVDVLFIMV